MPGMITNPEPGDSQRAEDILREIQELLRKRGWIIAHQPSGTILGKVPAGLGTTVNVMAVIRMITPDLIEWAPIEWHEGEAKPGDKRVIQ